MASLWKLAFPSSGSDGKNATEGEASKGKQKTGRSCDEVDPGENESRTTRMRPTDRYQHDMNQAIAMRGGNTRPLASHASETDSLMVDIELGFKGLDEADTFRVAGDYDQSLKLYELSLELLIKVLKRTRTAESQSPYATLETEPIEARVAVALSDAERVKTILGRRPNTPGASRSPIQKQSPESKSLRSLSNALSSALHKRSTGHSSIQHSPPVDRQPKQLQDFPLNDELSKMILSDFLVDAKSLHRTTWDDISGLERVKQALQESAILPLMRPDLFSGLRKPKNILLYGPPGTGKTMLVRAVAQESGSRLFCVTAAVVTSKWMGEAEKLVRVLFAVARQVAPSLVFIDEVDSLLSARKSDGEHEASRRLKTEFMVQMDGISKVDADDQSSLLLVLACTNCPWDVDAAVLRRFPRRLFVPLPDEAARRGLLSSLLKRAGRHSLTLEQIGSLARRLDGFSCADVSAIASEASFGPLRSVGGPEAIRRVQAKDIRPICMSDFELTISQGTKSVTPSQIERYDEWKREITS